MKNYAELTTFRLSEPEASCKRAVSEQQLEVVCLSEKSFAQAKCPLTALLVSRSYVFFTYFCFELAFSVNMKVLDNFVSFPMHLV